MNIRFLFILLVFALSVTAQKRPIEVKYYYPKDSLKFHKEVGLDFDYNYEKDVYGKTTMLIHCESEVGYFEFVFKKKIQQLSRVIDYKEGSVGEIYNPKNKKWEHEKGTWQHSEMKGKPIDTLLYSVHQLHALVLLHDHGGLVEKIKFQDAGNPVYWPEFDYANCSISDENKDGKPEFYLAYLGESDGLDAKPYKQIIYSFPDKPKSYELQKAKATAYYPAGNEDDVYNVVYDPNWKKLPKAIQLKSNTILKKHKKKYELKLE
ncbi:hypothetical protein [Flavobacterium polysaccharolyticum]|uniref:Uncharacterized protein n=1 Tax=Flavobacterium polysaccharolyticum TaxID=3133148 RepID=A0ABU9NPA8_9FLAO